MAEQLKKTKRRPFCHKFKQQQGKTTAKISNTINSSSVIENNQVAFSD